MVFREEFVKILRILRTTAKRRIKGKLVQISCVFDTLHFVSDLKKKFKVQNSELLYLCVQLGNLKNQNSIQEEIKSRLKL